jgi:hypothetical protein
MQCGVIDKLRATVHIAFMCCTSEWALGGCGRGRVIRVCEGTWVCSTQECPYYGRCLSLKVKNFYIKIHYGRASEMCTEFLVWTVVALSSFSEDLIINVFSSNSCMNQLLVSPCRPLRAADLFLVQIVCGVR